MTALRELVYVRPGFGGVFDYSEALLGVLRDRCGASHVHVVTAKATDHPYREGRRLGHEVRRTAGLVLAELGSGDASILWSLANLPSDRQFVLTIHDPGVVVSRLLPLCATPDANRTLAILDSLAGRAERVLIGNHLIRAVIRRAAARLVLNESIREVAGLPVTYLPQLVYTPDLVPYQPPGRPMIAFCGFWDPSKGLEELLAAYIRLLPRYPDADFVIAGGGVERDNAYERDLGARARAASSRIRLPGFVPADQFSAFLGGLSTLVVPYHAEVPGAASAMLLRAQELGVPLAVSDTPRLRPQVDPANVTLVPPRDVDALTEAIARHLDDPARCIARAAAEQARVYREHSRSAVLARLEAIIGPLAR